jgi:phosphatidylinositol alpha-mannosyltransferase
MSTGTAPSRSLPRRVAWYGIRIAVVATVAVLVVWRLDWGALRAAFQLQSWGFVTLAICANALSVVFKGVAWKGVIDALPAIHRPVRLRRLISPLFIGFLFNTVLAARVGEIAKVLLVRRKLAADDVHLRTTTLLGSVLAENLVSTITWVALVLGIGLFLPLPSYAWITAIVLGVACLVIVVVALLSSPGRQVPPWLRTGPLWARATRAFVRLWGAVRESHLGLREPKRMAGVVAASLATWGAQWAGIYCTLVAFGLERVGWGGAGLLLVTVTLAQTFPVLPGNLVLFQAAAVVPLTASYGVSTADALAFSIVLQATEVVVGVAIGFICLLIEGVGFKQLRAEAEEEERSRMEEPVDTLGGA